MTDDKKAASAAEHEDAPEPAAGEEMAAEPDPAEALAAENADLRDRLLRAAAEMENVRKRAEREARDAGQYAITGFARDLLAIGDNMRRALDSMGAEAREGADPAVAALIDGVEMTERELLKVMERHGVQRVEPAGERFDPHLHQAMFEVEDPSVPAGTVAQVMQPGYTINGRVLRPAMVGVAKGGPKPAPAPQDGAPEAELDEAPADPASGPGATVNRTA